MRERTYEHRYLADLAGGKGLLPPSEGWRSSFVCDLLGLLEAEGLVEVEGGPRQGIIRVTDSGKAFIHRHGDGRQLPKGYK